MALLQFQFHSCEEIVYFSRDFSTTFIQYIQHNEVTSGQQVLYRCFHCARLVSKYRISLSSFKALLQFQFHSCEEIVYFSRDFSTTFIHYIQHNEVTSGQQVLYRCFHCARLVSKYRISLSSFIAHSCTVCTQAMQAVNCTVQQVDQCYGMQSSILVPTIPTTALHVGSSARLRHRTGVRKVARQSERSLLCFHICI